MCSRFITNTWQDAIRTKHDLGFVGMWRDIKSNAEKMERLVFSLGTPDYGIVVVGVDGMTSDLRGLQDKFYDTIRKCPSLLQRSKLSH